MNDIWSKWSNHYKNLRINPKEICKDGIIAESEDKYRGMPKRILYILKERREHPGEDFRTAFREDPWKELMIWTGGILGGFSKTYSEAEKEYKESPRKYLDNIAVINLKKIAGDEKADMREINAFAYQDRELLREQIDQVIKPTDIICCGVSDMRMIDILVWLFEFQVTARDLLSEIRFTYKSGAKIISTRHPSNDTKLEETYLKLKSAYASIPSN